MDSLGFHARDRGITSWMMANGDGAPPMVSFTAESARHTMALVNAGCQIEGRLPGPRCRVTNR